MASASEGEDENYWPGYVDALTTMTMVLTFVLMILGVMVFVLSNDAASSRMRAIARALQVNEAELTNLDNEDLRSVVQAAIDAARAAGHPGSLGVGGSGGDAPGGRLAGTSGDGSGAAFGPGGMAGGGIGITAQAPPKASAEFESTFRGGIIGKEAAGLGGEYKIINQPQIAGVQDGQGERIEKGAAALRFVFDAGSLELPEQGIQALESYLASVGFAPLSVVASANPDAGISEGRRRAYYRALLVRNYLVKLGMRSDLVTVRINDAPAFSMPETLDIARSSLK